MPDSSSKQLESFRLARVPVLPHLLLQSPLLAPRGDTAGPPLSWTDYLDRDVFFHLKLLARYRELPPMRALAPDALAEALGSACLEARAGGELLRAGFEPLEAERLCYYKAYWRQARLCSLWAGELAVLAGFSAPRRAAQCGRLLNGGELVLEAMHGDDYRELHRQAASPVDLVALERARFGVSHVEVGADLLHDWGLDDFTCDALRYHHESAEDIVDASPLVRLCWLASALADAPGREEEALRLGKPLLGIKGNKLASLRERLAAQVAEEAAFFALDDVGDSRHPLVQPDDGEAARRDAECAAAAREQAQHLSYLNSLSPVPAAPGDLTQRLADSLFELFGLESFAVFVPHGDDRLVPRWSRPHDERLAQLTIRHGKREGPARESLVAACFRNAASRSSRDMAREELSVVDRQLLDRLGKRHLHCEAVRDGSETVAVLVLGCQAEEMELFAVQPLAAARLARQIVDQLRDSGPDKVTDLLQQHQAREIVHEVNNPLAIIKNYLQLLERKQEGDAGVREDIQVIRQEIDRVGRTVGRLKQTESGGEPVETDLNQLLESLARLFEGAVDDAETAVDIRLELDPRLPRVVVQDDRLRQIAVNLLLNAVEALAGKGVVTVRTYAMVFPAGRQRHMALEVSDDGPGIAPEAMEKLFAFGNTTKGGDHAGAGLAVVKRLTEEMGGSVICRSGSAGTTFSVLLPSSGSGAMHDNK